MNNKKMRIEIEPSRLDLEIRDFLKRLEGMQDPEERLVGDVAQRIPQQDATEERSGESSGVGEIGGAVELEGHIERILDESRLAMINALKKGSKFDYDYNLGKSAGMIELCEIIAVTYSQRSDLSNNAKIQQPAQNKTL